MWGIPSCARRASLFGLEGSPPGDSSFQPFLAPCGLGARMVRILLPGSRVVPGTSLLVIYFSGPLGRVAHSSPSAFFLNT